MHHMRNIFEKNFLQFGLIDESFEKGSFNSSIPVN